MEFRILGPLRVFVEEKELGITAPKLRSVLALLVLNHNRLVTNDALIDELWEESPPRSVATTLQTYIYQLRKAFAEAGQPDVILTRPRGYVLQTPPASIDLWNFEELVQQGRASLTEGIPDKAARLLQQALSLWQGPPLVDVVAGRRLRAHAAYLEEQWLSARELYADARLQLGRHSEVIGELLEATARYPLRENLSARLMVALYRSGRTGEALAVYQRLHNSLVNELGLEPSPALRKLQTLVLTRDPALELDTSVAYGDPPKGTASGPPAQLPPDIPDFTARQNLLDEFQKVLSPRAVTSTPPILMLTGMPGVGKSALAVHLAHRIKDSYPDGQLYIPLRDSKHRPADPRILLGDLLRSVGIASDQIPDGLEGRSALLRSWYASRRVLVVIDDATSAMQALPFLPGCGGSGVIVTSRLPLYGLAGSHLVTLEPLSPSDGLAMLAAIIGPRRVWEERAEAEATVSLCGGLPLALRIAGVRVARSHDRTLSALRARLTPQERRIAELRVADLSVEESMASAFEELGADIERACRLLRQWPGSGLPASRVAHFSGLFTSGGDHALLNRLLEHSLISVRSNNEAEPRYEVHELVRLYADHWIRYQSTDSRIRDVS